MEAHEILRTIDQFETRCPKLGHQVSFEYCRKESAGLPCSRSLACWRLRFPVEVVLRRYVTEDEWNRVFQQAPASRIDSLLQAIDKATKSVP